MERVKRAAARRKTTLRRLVLDALEQSLKQKPERFELRDAAVGCSSATVDAGRINHAIDELRQQAFQP